MGGYRVSFIGGLAVGFVLGTRAGRERYEQMSRLARKIVDSPAAQQAAGAMQAQAAGLATSAKDKITGQLGDRVPKMAEAAKHTVSGHMPGRRDRDRSHRDGDGKDGSGAASDRNFAAAGGPDDA